MENNVANVNNMDAVDMQADASELKMSPKSKKKKKKSTRPKLRPLPAVDEDNLESGLGYGDIVVVPPPTPRDKLSSDLQRLEENVDTLPKFTPEWFKAKEDLALVRMKLDDWDNSTPTAAKMETPILTTNAAYQDIVKSISKEEEERMSISKGDEGQPSKQIEKKKKKKKSSRKNRPKLKPQSVEKKEEVDKEDGLGFNDILLTKGLNKPAVVSEHTTLLDQVDVRLMTDAAQSKSNVGVWLLRSVIFSLLCYLSFKYFLP